jgi:hypothetical protein
VNLDLVVYAIVLCGNGEALAAVTIGPRAPSSAWHQMPRAKWRRSTGRDEPFSDLGASRFEGGVAC